MLQTEAYAPRWAELVLLGIHGSAQLAASALRCLPLSLAAPGVLTGRICSCGGAGICVRVADTWELSRGQGAC